MDVTAFLIGENIYLRPFERGDIDHVRKWYNDPQLRGSIEITEPYSREKTEQWYDNVCKDDHRIWFAIALKSNDEVIGECGLMRMFYAWRTTDLTMIIGESDAQGKGYGSEAMRLLLDYAFGHLGFHRVALGVAGFNDDAISFYERHGFRREGIQREGYYCNHKYHDFVMMSLLEEEYRQSLETGYPGSRLSERTGENTET